MSSALAPEPATITASPEVSYFGLPALPQSCLYSKTLIGIFPPQSESYLSILDKMTLVAGRLTPAARVGVAANSLITPFLNDCSTISLLDCPNPAWWKATPLDT